MVLLERVVNIFSDASMGTGTVSTQAVVALLYNLGDENDCIEAIPLRYAATTTVLLLLL